MERDEEASEYYGLSLRYLRAANELLSDELYEPAVFNAIHALELAAKSALLKRVDNNLMLHQVGGLFGREFRKDAGNEVCRRVNTILAQYNLPRYPGTADIEREEAESTIKFVNYFITKVIPALNKE